MVDVTTVYDNYVKYVFGDVTLAALGFLFIVTMIGIRYKWSLEAYVLVYSPILTLLLGKILPMDIEPLVLLGLGSFIGFGLLAYIRR